MKNVTLKDALSEGIKTLEWANILDARLDAWYLMEYYFQIDRARYLIHSDDEITKDQLLEYNTLIKKRASHYPLQYITGTQEFMGLSFQVSPAVLIPRQDTEVLVEEVMKIAPGKEVLDLCTGSGCIITSLAKLCPLKSAVGADISKEALEIAHRNIKENQVQVTLIQSDLFEDINGVYDIIVSNPPYIPTKDVEELMEEVKDHEPKLALDGKEDGLYFYSKIVREAKRYLKNEGYIFFEIGYNQGEDLRKLFEEAGYKEIQVIKDLSGLERVVKAKLSLESNRR